MRKLGDSEHVVRITVRDIDVEQRASLPATCLSVAPASAMNRAVTRFFPGYEPIANLDGRKTAMTVRDLLTMRTGLEWSEDPEVGRAAGRIVP
jgi:hypothetical protein